MYTMQAFANAMPGIELIVVLPEIHHSFWKDLCASHQFSIAHTVISGGETRFHSVKNGLAAVSTSLVAVHDAVRPLIEESLIQQAFSKANELGNVVVMVPLKESIRKVEGATSTALDRSAYFLVQTPQVFSTEILKKAYKQVFQSTFTDDASVVESLGVKINWIEGKYTNIKITYAEDIVIAEALLA